VCGIAGLLSPNPENAETCVSAMLDVQRHRGPDDRGIWRSGGVCIGQVRLSILDLSPAGHQPMLLDGGRLSIVFNGEIFNYIEVRKELQSRGHSFISGSDTEVILHAYDEWGPECCARFNGMWAFALWDERRRALFCSRDRFGVKPFYHAMDGGRFLFASEIKGLIAAAPGLAVPDEGYLARFLRTSLTDDDERTFFRDVRALLPGHSVYIEMDDAGVRMGEPRRYWDFDRDRALATYDYADPSAQLRELLADSVRLRLRADVPVGTCLSGGLDSSSIVALASRQLGGPVWTFSALYPDTAYDESRFARLVNASFDTVPHEVFPKPGRLLDTFAELAWHQDQPSAGPGLYSQWHVMEAASRDVKVLLDGQGADELLGGYEPYYADYVRSLARQALRSPGGGQLADLSAGWSAARARLGGSLTRTLALGLMSEKAKRLVRPLRGQSGRPEVRAEFLGNWQGAEDAWAVRGPFEDRLSNVLYDAVFTKSLPALLRYEDRNSMAFSIEARTPFLDYRLVEFGLALPFDQRIRGDWTKWALRKAMEGTLPDEITWRRDKLGYPTPFAEWLRSDFRADAEEVILSREFRDRGIFDGDVVERMWREHLAGDRDNSWNVWRWLSVEFWYRTFIDSHANAPVTL
jgi:asparagine synthase (glutamine-hydrolysing)